MKSFFLSSLLLVCLVFSCISDDDGPGPDTDLTTQIVGSYTGTFVETDDDGESTTLTDVTAQVQRVSDDMIMIALTFDGDTETFNATMTSATAFTVPAFDASGVMTMGSGALSGSNLTITLTDADDFSFSYTGTRV
ncbi:MAG: hypothetical protein AAGF87_16570 [Bacteroidota bacterium]